jgi:ubiquinone/menaquinone biosynthesis C-methylase UbiE
MKVQDLARQYRGENATLYDENRTKLNKYKNEQAIVEEILSNLSEDNNSVIDIPVGTGRFVEAYKRYGYSASGFDISPDMLAIAQGKVKELDYVMDLREGNVMDISVAKGSYDIAVCICFLNWVNFAEAETAIAELCRVSRRYVILSMRHYVPRSELRLASPNGLFHFLTRPAGAVRSRLSKNALIIHHKSDVFQMVKQNNLDIMEAIRVTPRKFGTDYFIYLLRKQENQER